MDKKQIIKNTFRHSYYETAEVVSYSIESSMLEEIDPPKRERVIQRGSVNIRIKGRMFRLIFRSDEDVKGFLNNIYEKENGEWVEISPYTVGRLVIPEAYPF